MPVEAMAAGAPVLAQQTGGTAESVVPGLTGALCTFRSPGAMREGVEIALSTTRAARSTARSKVSGRTLPAGDPRLGRRPMTSASVRPGVLVNQSYAMQRVTGQQRYATEIASRLLQDDQFKPVAPNRFWARSTARVWTWIQFVLPWLARGSVLLSMTSRAPWWRRRQVLVVHDLFVLTNPGWFSRLYYLTHAPLLRAQIRSAAAVVAVSQPTADQLASFYRGPIVVAPNAPSATFADWDGTDDEVLRRLGLPAHSYFLAVGSLDPRKNLRRLAQAYGRLSADERRAHPAGCGRRRQCCVQAAGPRMADGNGPRRLRQR